MEGNNFWNQPRFLCSPDEQIILIWRVKCGNRTALPWLERERRQNNQISIFMLSLRNSSPCLVPVNNLFIRRKRLFYIRNQFKEFLKFTILFIALRTDNIVTAGIPQILPLSEVYRFWQNFLFLRAQVFRALKKTFLLLITSSNSQSQPPGKLYFIFSIKSFTFTF